MRFSSLDRLFCTDRILVQPLTGTQIKRVNINLTGNLARDGVEDVISIHGTPIRSELLVENIDATLIEAPSNQPPVIGGVMRISGFRGHAQTIADPYEILTMNFGDRVLVNTHDANDLVTVRGTTGPTWIDSSAGDDVVEVEAVKVADPKAETGDFFSEVHVDAGSGSNRLVVNETGTSCGVPSTDYGVQDRERRAGHHEINGGVHGTNDCETVTVRHLEFPETLWTGRWKQICSDCRLLLRLFFFPEFSPTLYRFTKLRLMVQACKRGCRRFQRVSDILDIARHVIE